MGKKKGYRPISQMKYHIYHKIYHNSVYPAFSVMFTAGTKAILPTPLENIKVQPGVNTNYGVAFGQIVNSVVASINNFAVSQLNNATFNGFMSKQYSILQVPTDLNGISNVMQAYDWYVANCGKLYQPAIFDITYFDLSVYVPAKGTLTVNAGCEKLEQQFSQISKTPLYVQPEKLGVGVTSNPTVDQQLLTNLQGTGIGDLINKLAKQKNISDSQYFASLPDFAKYALSIIAELNKIIDSGFALDVAWLDRCVLAPNESQTNIPLINLENGFIVQYFGEALGIILDYTPLDFAPLIPDIQSSELEYSILTVDKAIIEIFGTILLQHFQDPSPGGIHIGNSQQAENYILAYQDFMNVQKIVNRKYANIWYAKMVASAIIEVARYPYQQNYTYSAGERTLSYDQFLAQWKQKWSFYGLKPEDLQYAQTFGEQLQHSAKIQNDLKAKQKSIYTQTWKPAFYYKNFKNIANR